MYFDGVLLAERSEPNPRPSKRITHHPEAHLLLAILSALFTILTTAGRRDQRRGGFARGGKLAGDSLFSTSVTTRTSPRRSGGRSYATDHVTAPACPDRGMGATIHLAYRYWLRRQSV